MEDVLEVYKQPYNSKYPLVCMDESSKQQVKEVRAPLPTEPEKKHVTTPNTNAMA